MTQAKHEDGAEGADQDPWLAQLAGMLVATADYGDAALDASVQRVLATLRSKMRMDVVFVSKFEDGRRVFKLVDAAPGFDAVQPGGSDPLEQSWCHHIVSGRLPEFIQDASPLRASGAVPATPLEIGTHLSVPVVLQDGTLFGTVCAFAFYVNDEITLQDIWRLRAVADVIARRVEPPKG
jgi:GAF domain-containing protein